MWQAFNCQLKAKSFKTTRVIDGNQRKDEERERKEEKGEEEQGVLLASLGGAERTPPKSLGVL